MEDQSPSLGRPTQRRCGCSGRTGKVSGTPASMYLLDIPKDRVFLHDNVSLLDRRQSTCYNARCPRVRSIKANSLGPSPIMRLVLCDNHARCKGRRQSGGYITFGIILRDEATLATWLSSIMILYQRLHWLHLRNFSAPPFTKHRSRPPEIGDRVGVRSSLRDPIRCFSGYLRYLGQVVYTVYLRVFCVGRRYSKRIAERMVEHV